MFWSDYHTVCGYVPDSLFFFFFPYIEVVGKVEVHSDKQFKKLALEISHLFLSRFIERQSIW